MFKKLAVTLAAAAVLSTSLTAVVPGVASAGEEQGSLLGQLNSIGSGQPDMVNEEHGSVLGQLNSIGSGQPDMVNEQRTKDWHNVPQGKALGH